MNTTEERTVGQIVADDYRAAQVMRDFGIDFCCGGKQTLEEACRNRGVDSKKVQSALEAFDGQDGSEHNYSTWSPGFLIDYIVNNHHEYIRSKLPEMRFYADKVARVHGEAHPELVKMQMLMEQLSEGLLEHLKEEEEVLFPYIKRLSAASEKNADLMDLSKEGTANPIVDLEADHEEAGAIMARLEELSNGFEPPADACTTYQVYFQNLKAFRDDLHKHVHLENNILFVKARELDLN